MLIDSGEWTGLSCAEAQQKMTAFAKAKGFGEATVTFRLKDWGVSRQRYWGTPIPMLYCEKDGIVPVPDDQLPVLLPENVEITQEGGSPLAKLPEFVNATCPEVRRPGAARDGHDGHLRRFVLVLLSLYQREGRRPLHLIPRRWRIGSPSTSTSAAWSTPSCT